MSGKTSFLVFTFLLFVLLLRFYFFNLNKPLYLDGQHVKFHTTLTSDPQIVGNQQRIYANLATGERILVITSLIPEFHYADTVIVDGSIRILPRAGGFQPRAPKKRSYRASSRNNILLMYFPKIEVGKEKSRLAIISSLRQKLISIFSKSLHSSSSSLLLGIVFGIKEQMPKDFKDNLRASGVLHVIAASGMNVTLIGGFLSSLFTYFLRRQLAVLLSIIGILFYAMLAGLEPSIVRASIMGILVFSSQILGRQNMASNGLFIAGFLMLFVSPSLLSDVGFQLSFMATLGLLYIKPLLEQNLKFKAIIEKSFVGSGITTTIAAQLATMPILLVNFGSYSIWSVLVNGLVLWTIPSLMVIGAAGGLVGLVFMPFGKFIIYLSYPFLLYFEKIVNIFGQIGGILVIRELPWSIIVGYYSILASSVLFFGRKALKKI